MGDLRGGSQSSFPKATEIHALVQLFWLMFKLESRDQKAEAQLYHHSKLQVSFLGRMQRYLHIFHAKGIMFEIDIIYLRLCSERVQLRRCSL